MAPFYDTHVHVWTLDPANYPWRSVLPQARIPEHAFTAEQLKREMDAAGVQRAVLVQPSTYGWDHRYLFEALARDPDRFHGVALVDPSDPALHERVSELGRATGVRGLRFHVLEPEHEAVFTRAWTSVARAALDNRLVVTVQAAPNRLAPVAAMAKACPDLAVVVDHLGLIRWSGPGSPGLDDLLALSTLPNVYVKLSGLEVISGGPAPFESARPLVNEIAHAFGAARMMWGSNSPHSLSAAPYRALAGAVESCLCELTERELELVRWGTAMELWG